MRLRRLCEVKPSGKSHVDEDIRKEYLAGGDKREILEIALVEALKKWGTSKSKSIFNKVKASSLKHGLHVFFYTLCTGVLYIWYALCGRNVSKLQLPTRLFSKILITHHRIQKARTPTSCPQISGRVCDKSEDCSWAPELTRARNHWQVVHRREAQELWWVRPVSWKKNHDGWLRVHK